MWIVLSDLRGNEKREPDYSCAERSNHASRRTIRCEQYGRLTDMALEALSARSDQLHTKTGRPSIPPEQLLPQIIDLRRACQP